MRGKLYAPKQARLEPKYRVTRFLSWGVRAFALSDFSPVIRSADLSGRPASAFVCALSQMPVGDGLRGSPGAACPPIGLCGDVDGFPMTPVCRPECTHGATGIAVLASHFFCTPLYGPSPILDPQLCHSEYTQTPRIGVPAVVEVDLSPAPSESTEGEHRLILVSNTDIEPPPVLFRSVTEMNCSLLRNSVPRPPTAEATKVR